MECGVIIMAIAQYKIPDEFLDKISRLADRTDEIIPRVLEAGAEVVHEQVRQNLQAVIGKGIKYPSRSTGELLGALGISPAKLDRNGNFNVKVGFDEPRSGTASNALVASVLEHGKHGQPPRPFMRPARSAARHETIEAMKRKLEEEVGNV